MVPQAPDERYASRPRSIHNKFIIALRAVRYKLDADRGPRQPLVSNFRMTCIYRTDPIYSTGQAAEAPTETMNSCFIEIGCTCPRGAVDFREMPRAQRNVASCRDSSGGVVPNLPAFIVPPIAVSYSFRHSLWLACDLLIARRQRRERFHRRRPTAGGVASRQSWREVPLLRWAKGRFSSRTEFAIGSHMARESCATTIGALST